MFERYRDIQKRRESGDASESGFTLIELLIVIVVLGVLAAIVVFSLTGVSGESKQAACTSDAKSVEIAADAYQAHSPTGSYPATVGALVGSYLHAPPGNTNGYTIGLNQTTDSVTITNNTTNATHDFVDTTGCTSTDIG